MLMKAPRGALRLLLVASSLLAADANCATASADDVRSLLCPYNLTLANVELELPNLHFAATVPSLVCHDLWLGDLSSSAPTLWQPNISALALSVSHVAFTCFAPSFEFNLLGVKGDGQVVIRSSGVALQSTLLLAQQDGAPWGAALDSTSMTIGALALDLHGNWATWLASKLEGVLASAIRAILPARLCTELDAFVASNVTALLRELDAAVAPLRPAPPELPEPAYPPPTELVDLRRGGGSSGGEEEGGDAIISLDGPLGLSGLIDAITAGSGALHIPLASADAPPLAILTSSAFNLTVALTALNLTGLDTISAAEVTRPPSTAPLDEAHTLHVRVNGSAVALGVDARLTLAIGGSASSPSPPLTVWSDAVQLELAASDALLSSALLAGVNASALASLLDGSGGADATLCTLLNPLLVGAAMRAISLRWRRVVLGLRSLHAPPSGGGSSGFDHQLAALINHMLLLLSVTFKPMAVDLVNGILGGPLRALANNATQALIDGLHSSTCPPPPPPPPPLPAPPGALPWNETALAWMSSVIDSDAAITAANSLLASVTDDGIISIDLPTALGQLPPLLASPLLNITIEPTALNFSGLDTITSLRPLVPSAADPIALSTSLGLGRLNASLSASVTLTSPLLAAAPATLDIRMAVALDRPHIAAHTRLAVQETIGQLQLRQLLLPTGACAAREVSVLVVDSLGASMDGATLEVYADDWKHGAALGALPPIRLDGPLALSPALARPLASGLTAAADAVLALLSKPGCPPAAPPAPPSSIDWRSSALRALLHNLTDSNLVNELIDDVTTLLSGPFAGAIRLPSPLRLAAHDPKLGNIGVALSDSMVAGLDSWFALEVFRADDDLPSVLHHTLGLGGASPVSINGSLELTILSQPHTFELSVELRNASLQMGTWLDVDGAKLGDLSLDELKARPPCALWPATNLSLTNWTLHVDDHERATGAAGVFIRVKSVDSAGGGGADASLPSDFVLNLAKALMPGLQAALNDRIATTLAAAGDACANLHPMPAAPPPAPLEPLNGLEMANDIDLTITACGAVVLVLAICALLVPHLQRMCRRHRKEEGPVAARASEPLLLADVAASAPDAEALGEFDHGSSPPSAASPPPPLPKPHGGSRGAYALPHARLFHQPALIQSGGRTVVVLLLAANMLLFIPYADGAEMYALASLADEDMPLPTIFYLSLSGTVTDFVKAKQYLVGIVVGIASLSWPYCRIAIMAGCLFARPSSLTPDRCETLLRLVDATGKWAMIDYVMLSLLSVAFKLDVPIPPPDPTGEPGGDDPFLLVQLRVMARINYVAFPLSVAVSILASHLLLSLQRSAQGAGERVVAGVRGGADAGAGVSSSAGASSQPLLVLGGGPSARIALCRHRFVRMPLVGAGRRRALPRFVRVGVPLALLACSITLLYSATCMPAFTITFDGLVGVLLQERSHTYPLIAMGTELVRAAGPKCSDLVAWVMVCITFGPIILISILYVAALVFLWIVPLSLSKQWATLRTAERLYAWSGLDVFCLTIIVGLRSVPQYAIFMLGDECNRIDPLLPYFSPLIPGSPKCLDLKPELHLGAWLLLGSTLAYVSIGFFVLHAARRAVAEREAEACGEPALSSAVPW